MTQWTHNVQWTLFMLCTSPSSSERERESTRHTKGHSGTTNETLFTQREIYSCESYIRLKNWCTAYYGTMVVHRWTELHRRYIDCVIRHHLYYIQNHVVEQVRVRSICSNTHTVFPFQNAKEMMLFLSVIEISQIYRILVNHNADFNSFNGLI